MASFRIFARWVFRFTLVLTTMVASPALSSLVLCLGSDGHVDVEYSVDGRCGPQDEAPDAAGLTHEDGEHCGTCLDFSFSSVEKSTPRVERGLDLDGALDLAPLDFLAQLPIPGPGLLPRPPPAEPFFLTHLRTIRLLV